MAKRRIVSESEVKQPLWPSQESGSNTLARVRRGILADKMGLGKTRTALATIEKCGYKGPQYKVLGVSFSNNAVYTIWDESTNWWGHGATVVEGTTAERDEIWRTASFPVCNLATLLVDRKRDVVPYKWHAILVDEADRVGLLSRKTKIFKLLKSILVYDVFIPMSGSYIKHGPQDLWPSFHLCDPKRFSSYWQFVNKYCLVEDGFFGKELMGASQDPEMLKELKGICGEMMVRRTKEQARPGMPPKIRQNLWVDMDPWQKQTYDDLVEYMMAERHDGSIIAASVSLTSLVRMRQLLVCPKVLDPAAGYGGLLTDIASTLVNLPPSERHSGICTPFRAAVPFIKQILEEAGLGPVYVFQGGMSVSELGEAVTQYKRNKGIAVVVIAFAQSFSFETSDKAFMCGFEYDYEANEQAEDRWHRGTSKRTVNIYYGRYRRCPVEDRIVEILNQNKSNVDSFIEKDGLVHILGARALPTK